MLPAVLPLLGARAGVRGNCRFGTPGRMLLGVQPVPRATTGLLPRRFGLHKSLMIAMRVKLSRFTLLVSCMFAASFCGMPLVQAQEIPSNVRASVDAAITRMRPALVRIHVVSTEYREGREMKMQAVGSGAIISKDGYLVTNHHVAGHGARMFCTLWNREEIEAELVGTDPLTDISIVKLKPDGPREFTAVSLGDSSKMRGGDFVLAVGGPMPLSQSLPLGIINNTQMIIPRFF